MCAILYFFLIVCNKPHANPTIINENIKEIHILAVGGTLEFPILSHVLLRRDKTVGTICSILKIQTIALQLFCQREDIFRYLYAHFQNPDLIELKKDLFSFFDDFYLDSTNSSA